MWSLKSGRLLGTFWGAHRGSVVCLKFVGDWERGWEDEGEDGVSESEGEQRVSDSDDSGVRVQKRGRDMEKPKKERKGFMVSGSSDCSVCVWDLTTGKIAASSDAGGGSAVRSGLSLNTDLEKGAGAGAVGNGVEADEAEREVNAEVRAVLKGHVGGVLDLRIDRRWIVSWYVFFCYFEFQADAPSHPNSSKDAVIRVWDRITLDLHRTLRGHEGPVNAVGLQSEKVVRVNSSRP